MIASVGEKDAPVGIGGICGTSFPFPHILMRQAGV